MLSVIRTGLDQLPGGSAESSAVFTSVETEELEKTGAINIGLRTFMHFHKTIIHFEAEQVRAPDLGNVLDPDGDFAYS